MPSVRVSIQCPNNDSTSHDHKSFFAEILCKVEEYQRRHCYPADSGVYKLLGRRKRTNRLYKLHDVRFISRIKNVTWRFPFHIVQNYHVSVADLLTQIHILDIQNYLSENYKIILFLNNSKYWLLYLVLDLTLKSSEFSLHSVFCCLGLPEKTVVISLNTINFLFCYGGCFLWDRWQFVNIDCLKFVL
jgi:hypothetical protein